MRNKPFALIVFALLTVFLLAACSASEATEDVNEVAVTRVVTETVELEGETVEVTVVVVETVTEIVEVEAEPMEEEEAMEEDYAMESPIAVAPAPSQSEVIAPEPTAAATAVSPRNSFFQDYGVNPYIQTNVDNLSTFSLDVDTGAYAVARHYINNGTQPPANAIRVEEFVNFFDQGYDNPSDVGFAIYADGAPSPFHNDGTHFVRI
ncbi:MAG: hypothetical protein GY943_14720, partial [Chloroflexi bacterium]|nr:hypothetical protein [Chloroflexota bacterium]